MTFFLVIDLVLRIFPFFSHIFRMFTMLNVVYMTISSQEKHNFHSVHAFTHIRQHYFSKYWGGPMHGRSPTSTFGGTVPPVPLGLRPCYCQCLVYRQPLYRNRKLEISTASTKAKSRESTYSQALYPKET